MTSEHTPLFEKILGFFLILLLAAITVLVLIQVCSRYVFQLPFIGLDELARLLFVWACFLGAALGTVHDRHVRIEFLARLLPARATAAFSLLASLCILSVSAVMVIAGTQFVVNRWTYPDYTTALLYPRSLFYAPVPVSGVIIFVYTLKHAIAHLKKSFR